MLTPWKESYDQPRQHIKKQRHYFVNKGPSSQGYGFSSGHAECRKADVFELWCWRLLRVPWTARRSNLSILKEISPGCSLVGLKFKLKLQYFDHHMRRADSFEKKDWGKKEKGTTDDEMVGWHHQHNGHGFGCPLGAGDEQGGLACCGSWCHKELDTTEQLNWTKRKKTMHINTFILTSFMTLMHWRYFIFPMERAPHGLHAAHGVNGVLTAQVCPETWRFPCLWRTECAFQFFPVQLTVLSGKTKTKQFLDNDLKYSKTLHIFIFLSVCWR